jgi:prophage regulatory protein
LTSSSKDGKRATRTSRSQQIPAVAALLLTLAWGGDGAPDAVSGDSDDDDEGDGDPDERRPYQNRAARRHSAVLSSANPPRFLRLPEVMRRTGYGRSSIYAKMTRGEMPKSVKLGSKAIGFIESEIDEWIASRISRRAEAV